MVNTAGSQLQANNHKKFTDWFKYIELHIILMPKIQWGQSGPTMGYVCVYLYNNMNIYRSHFRDLDHDL